MIAGNLVDTHCHLDFNAFDEDRDEVVRSARSVGIVRIMNPGISLETSRAAIEQIASRLRARS